MTNIHGITFDPDIWRYSHCKAEQGRNLYFDTVNGLCKKCGCPTVDGKAFLAVLHLLSGVKNADLVLVMEVIK